MSSDCQSREAQAPQHPLHKCVDQGHEGLADGPVAVHAYPRISVSSVRLQVGSDISIIRGTLLAVLVVLTTWLPTSAQTTTDLLPSWNDGAAKQAILNVVRNTTDAASTSYVLREDRYCHL